MAQITLTYGEANLGHGPQLCMECGAKAGSNLEKQFQWKPRWIGVFILMGLLPYLIAAVMTNMKMRVMVPFCEEHKNHFAKRQLFGWGGFVALVMMFCALAWVPKAALDSVLIGDMLAVLAWLFGLAIYGQWALRPTEITTRDITLTNVSDAYVQALQQIRRDNPDRAPIIVQAPPATGSSAGFLMAILIGLMVVAVIAGAK